MATACNVYAPVLTPTSEPEASTPAEGKRAATPKPSKRHPESDARELYRLAEARYADGDVPGSVALLQESLEASPDDVDPKLRHQLEARLTFLQLTAWTSTDDLSFVLDARQRLFTRLAGFPEVAAKLTPAEADAMRSDLFEQLGDVEAQLEAALPEDGAPETTDAELTVLAAASEATGSEPSARKPAASRKRKSADGGEIREVRVKSSRDQRLEDPDVQRRARGAFSRTGPVLTQHGVELIHGPRGLVRVMKATDPAGRGARSRAREAIVARRDALTECYGQAFARHAIYGLQLEVTWVTRKGQITEPSLTKGVLIDSEGDRCLLAALSEEVASSDAPLPDGPATARLLFFFEDALYMVSDTGEFLGPGQMPTKPTAAGPSAFDGINQQPIR